MARVALVGFGSMGKNHARILNNLEGVKLVGICDPLVEEDKGEKWESSDVQNIGKQ